MSNSSWRQNDAMDYNGQTVDMASYTVREVQSLSDADVEKLCAQDVEMLQADARPHEFGVQEIRRTHPSNDRPGKIPSRVVQLHGRRPS